MRITDTTGQVPVASGAVSPLTNRPGDVDSTTQRRTPMTPATPGTRATTTATRTTTTSRRPSALAPSADDPRATHAEFSLEDLVAAYLDCRRTKRNSASALAFEQQLERNLVELHDELIDGSWRPGRSICFVITRPKPREAWAADFRDRIVHHLLYRRVAPAIEATFIADSCACIPGRGTLYAAQRLEAKVRSVTQNWSRPAWYLKCDLANFFVAIDKRILAELLAARIREPWWLQLALQILFHDPRVDVDVRGDPDRLALVPPHKRLLNQSPDFGLPIGNLSSQFFANVFLDVLDQHVKHTLRARRYIRYVDDFLLLHESPQWLNAARGEIEAFLPRTLGAQLNPTKTILQPIARGIDFVGQALKPWRRSIRRRTFHDALTRVAGIEQDEILQTVNSYFGLLRQAPASHRDRARLANLVRRRGRSVNRQLTQTYAMSRSGK